MNCNICNATKCIPNCFDLLVVGTIAATDTDVDLYVKDVTLGRTYKYEETSSSYGQVSWNKDGFPALVPTHHYELWVTLRDAGISANETITIDATEVTCLNLNVERAYDENGDLEVYPVITLELE